MAVFSGLVLATTGKLPSENRDIKRWVDAHGGAWSPSMSKQVTHLVAGADAWKKADKAVLQAIKYGAFIVSYDWLEDSLQRKRKLSEKKYTWEDIDTQKKMRSDLKKRGVEWDGKKFRRGCIELKELTGSGKSIPKPKAMKGFFFPAEEVTAKDTKRDVCSEKVIKSPHRRSQTAEPIEPATPSSSQAEPHAKTPHIKDLYHNYTDATGFVYQIVLICTDPSTNTYARYRVFLMESHSKPHTYATLVEYTPPKPQMPWMVQPTHKIKKEPDELPPHKRLPWNHNENNGATEEDDIARHGFPITQAVPSSDKPHKALICPMQSEYHMAWRAFRHVFRDLTLLSWEERLDAEMQELQLARAKHYGCKPYRYRVPEKGLPFGLVPQDPSLVSNDDQDYVRDSFGLPGVPRCDPRSASVVKKEIKAEKLKSEEAE